MAENKDKLKTFGLTNFAVDNMTSIFFLAGMIFVFGVSAYNNIPKESFPEIPWPKIYVNTVYFGNSAEDIENLVTKPLEKELADISEIKNVVSTSLQDYSLIEAEFEADVDLDVATRKVKDAVDKAMVELPTDLTKDPEVLDINMSEIPIMTVNLAGNFSNEELKKYAEYLEDEFEELPEISSIDIKGDQEREVKIDVDPMKMRAMQISFGDLTNAIQGENLTMSGGELVNDDFRRTVRVIGEFEEVDEIQEIIVKAENQNPIYLKDIAEVTFGYKDRSTIARADKLPVISLDVIKKSGENLIVASEKIRFIVEEASENYFPEGLEWSIFNDQSIQTKNQVSNLENSIISGVILVTLVLLFFLGLRNATFVGIAIPTSMLLGFLIISLLGYSINMVILFGLILALGMLVDNAIVVVENVYRYMQEGYDGKQAAKYATGEVAIPIIASTATTLAAFVPLAFWPGLMGSFMKFLPITLIIVLTSSLFVALVINPVFTARFMKVDEKSEDKEVRVRRRRNGVYMVAAMLIAAVLFHFLQVGWLRNLLIIVSVVTALNIFVLRDAAFAFQNNVIPILENAYDRFIRFSLKGFNPYLIFGGTIALLIGSLVLLGIKAPNTVLFPEADPLYVNAFVELPLGSDIEATNDLMREFESQVTEVVEPYGEVVESVLAQIGRNTSDPNAGPDFSASPNKGRITVSFVPSEERGEISTAEIMEKIRTSLTGFSGVEIVVDQNANGPPTGKPVNIEVTGDDIVELSTLSENMVKYIEDQGIAGIEELKQDVFLGKPELIVNIDREAARRFGISTYQIADVIRTAIFGKEVSKFKTEDEDYDIMVRIDEKYRNNIDAVLNQVVTFRNPANGRIAQVPISAVADVNYSTTYNSIKRKDQERVITIYSNVLDGYNANEIVQSINDALSDFEMPVGYSYEFTGEQEEQAENMAFLGGALLVALFVIFLILVAQFNSISMPFIILISIIFSTIGVFLGYVFTGMDIVIIMTGVGIISLAGIVVNNAIVLIDYINLLMERKREELGLPEGANLDSGQVLDAVVKGGSTRLRPVLLTAITTILGLIPLAIGFNFNFFTFVSDWDPQYFVGGDNADFWGTMAWTVIYGLTFATFLTLIVVPVMYWLMYKFKVGISKLWNKTNNDPIVQKT